jgi:hypothetical protein
MNLSVLAYIIFVVFFFTWIFYKRLGIPLHFGLFLTGFTIVILIKLFNTFLSGSKAQQKIQDKIDNFLADLKNLSVEEAKSKAEDILSNPISAIEAIENSNRDVNLDQLAPLVGNFFRRYQKVLSEITGPQLGHEYIKAFELKQGFIKIGQDDEHTAIVIEPNKEMIYEFDEDSLGEERRPTTFPTIYHYIIYVDWYI